MKEMNSLGWIYAYATVASMDQLKELDWGVDSYLLTHKLKKVLLSMARDNNI